MKRLLLSLVLLVGCSRRHPATDGECAALVDRMIAIELRQAGFRDPVLEKARADELRPLLAPELAACKRLALSPSTVACAQKAASARALAHDCLR
jgi:hypothetical protein